MRRGFPWHRYLTLPSDIFLLDRNKEHPSPVTQQSGFVPEGPSVEFIHSVGSSGTDWRNRLPSHVDIWACSSSLKFQAFICVMLVLWRRNLPHGEMIYCC